MPEKASLILEVNGTCYRLDDDPRSEFRDFGAVRIQRSAGGDFVVQGNRDRLRVAGQTVASVVLQDGLNFTVGRDKCRCYAWKGADVETDTVPTNTDQERLEDRILINALKKLETEQIVKPLAF